MKKIDKRSGEANAQEAEAPNWRQDRVLWLIMGLAAILGLVYNCAILQGYGPDELRHMRYVELLLDDHRLPFLQADGKEYKGAHSLHPPLYYLVLVPFFALARLLAGEAGWHIVRVVSMLLCLVSLPLLYEVTLRVAGDRNTARLTVALLALLPMFGMTAGAINNDSASLLAFSVFLWLLVVRFPEDNSWRAAVWLGVVLGLGSLCKATVVIADVGAFIAFSLYRGPQKAGLLLRQACMAVLAAAIVGGPWYIRNFAMYGKFSPIEAGYTNPALPNPDSGILVMMMHDNFPALFQLANSGLFYTLWSQKDWIPETIRGSIYNILLVFCVIALGGNLLAWKKGGADHKSSEDSIAKAGRRAAYGAFALSWLACLFMALFKHWGWAEGGRYLLASLFGFSLFLALGWRGVVGQARLKGVLAVWCLFAVILNVICIYWLFAYLNPTFGPK